MKTISTFAVWRRHAAYSAVQTSPGYKRPTCKRFACSQSSRIAFDLPELLEIQRASFNKFVQQDIPDLFSQLAPIRVEGDDVTVELHLDGNNFQLIAPDDTPQDCIFKLKTYSCKLYIQAKIVYKTLADQILYSTQGEWVLIGHLPLMTKRGHFIINGSPRVIVHQVVRSPGIYFQQILHKDEKQKARFYGDIIPRRGVWLRLQTTKKGKIEAKLKKGKKVSADMLQRCLQLIERFERKSLPYPVQQLNFQEDQPYANIFNREHWATSSHNAFFAKFCETSPTVTVGVLRPNVTTPGKKMPTSGVVTSALNTIVVPKGLPSTLSVSALNNRLGLGKLVPTPIGELCAPSYEKKQSALVDSTSQTCYVQTPGVKTPSVETPTPLRKNGNTDVLNVLTEKFKGLEADEINAFNNAPEEKAMLHTYDKLYRPAEDREREEMSKKGKNSSFSNNTLTDRRLKFKRCYKNLFSTFKEKDRYDLSLLGREKINLKLGIYVPENQLTALDIYAASSWLHGLTKGEKNVDDIDHFQNRRIRTSGELLYAQFENGVDRLKKYTWNKLKKFVHLQTVQKTFRDLQDSREYSDVYARLQSHKWDLNARRGNAQRGNTIPQVGFNATAAAPGTQTPFRKSNRLNSGSVSTPDVSTPAQVRYTRVKNNGTAFFTTPPPEQTAIKDERNASFPNFNGTKSSPQIKPLNVSLSPSQIQLRSLFSSKPLSKRLPASGVGAATKNPPINGKNPYRSLPLSNKFDLQLQFHGWNSYRWDLNASLSEDKELAKSIPFVKIDKGRYHIRNTRYANSAPLRKLLIKQRHLLYRFKYLARRRWVCRQERGPFLESHTIRGVKTLDLEKNKKLLSANLNQSDSIVQHRLALPSLKEFLSTKPLNGALRELFGSNPLSQYMDQTNPLAEITHKRRMSSLGVGGVSRESAGMAIRGIHPTHYGRICPIETPEGKNAGLVNSLALYAKIDNKGFVATPYYKVVKGQVQHELGFTFFSAKQESTNHLNIAPSDLQQSWSNMLATDSVPVRVADNILDIFKKIGSYQVDCIGIAPVQMISVATSLIPFLEHNDANRALMGSNMQRQAVPLMIPERAIVGTGLESLVVAESGHLLQSESTGFISYVSANKIVVDSLCSATQNVSVYAPVKGLFSDQKQLVKGFISPFRRSNLFGSGCFVTSEIPTSGIETPGDVRKNKLTKELATPPLKQKNLRTTLSLNKNMLLQAQFLVDGTGNAYRRGQTCSRIFPLAALSDWPLKGNNSDRIYGKGGPSLPLGKAKGFVFADAKTKRPNASYSVLKKAFQQTGVCQDMLLFVKRRYAQAAQLPLNYRRKNYNCGRAKTSSLSRSVCFESMWYSTTNSKTAQRLKSSVHAVSNFDRSNQDTCLTQRALVKEGNWVQRGDILTDCSASDQGELAVGKNILVAYIPWEGYNFEDAIVISERLVKEHVYTSLHIERYDFNAQDVKEGSEWFTNDLPGIASKKVKHLDEFGLPKIGSFVKEGDILLGKIRYSNIKPTTPYERLLCDILGENNFSARDSSLYVPKGVHARVIKRKILTFFDNSSKVRSKRDKSPKLVHIFLGEKRAIQVGDKMSGRHGNKGVVATILPRQDMPYLADGTTIDIILNPLGVPSRMNVGQVFESLLGLAGTYLAQHFKIMCFDELYGVEASQSLVYLKLYQARLQSGQNWLFQVDFPGKTRLIDGRSGQCFDQWITVGRAYMLKLIHMVNEKIHARATGPYALITQQPLRGRSQKGGQRLGEMEVWALEGFGAAYILQELLTKKSDDMVGRKEVASAILPRPISILDIVQPSNRAQENRFILGQPEIFKVLICELQALCLDVGVYSLTTESFQRSFLSNVNHF